MLNDPDQGLPEQEAFGYSLNCHLGSDYNFAYGHSAPWIKFRELRGHESFCL